MDSIHVRAARRFVFIALIAGATVLALWLVAGRFMAAAPGDYAVRQGDILLSDGKPGQALERFEAALDEAPEHVGAMMGRAIALMQGGRPQEAEAAFTALIAGLEAKPVAENARWRGVLAAAHANRGILYDRTGRHRRALADYQRALAIDAETVGGPGLIDKVLYGQPDAATVAGRARYLEQQLALPEAERLLTLPEADARQRMYKP